MIRPGKIVCIGRNYLDHAKELGNEVPKEPLIFLKPPSSVIGTEKNVVMPKASKQVEYEGEIGVVIGKTAHKISPFEAAKFVKSIVAVNDVTARDLQKSDGQWGRAKGFDTFCPIGEECPDVSSLTDLMVVTRLNGAERQRGYAKDMAFSIQRVISYISHVMTLEPGDLIATGTPAGVGPLKFGDMVEVEVLSGDKSLSIVRNSVITEQ